MHGGGWKHPLGLDGMCKGTRGAWALTSLHACVVVAVDCRSSAVHDHIGHLCFVCSTCGCTAPHTRLHLHLLMSLHALLPLHAPAARVCCLHTLLHAPHMHVGHNSAPKDAYEHDPAASRKAMVKPHTAVAGQPAQPAQVDSSMQEKPAAPGTQQAAVAVPAEAGQQGRGRTGAWTGLWSTLLG